MQPDILNKQPVLFNSPRSLPPYLLLYDTSTHMASHNFPPIHGIRLQEQHSVRMQRWQCWWLALTWSTWKLRNNIVFSNATFNASKLFEDAIFTLWTWLRHFEKDFTIHFNQWSSSIRHGFCINATFLMWTWLHNLEKDFTLHFSQWSKEVISIGRVTQEVFECIAATSIRTEPAFESIAATTTRCRAFHPKTGIAESGTKESPKNSFHYLQDHGHRSDSDGQSEATSKRSRTTTRLRTLTLRSVDQPRPAVYVDPATGRASGPMREKFHSYLGVPIIHNNWKDVPETLKEIVWNDILDALRVYSDLGFSRNLMDFMVTTKEPEFLRDVDGTKHSSNSAEQVSGSSSRLVAMGKIMEGDSIIHTVAYADDVVRVSVEIVIDPEAEVPYATSEIQYVKQAVYTFVAWPTHLVKSVLDEHPQSIPHNEDAHVPKPANVDADDPLRGLMKYSFDIYDKPLEISFDGSFLGIVDASTSIFITYSDVTEIIAGDKSLNISVIQLWLMYMHEWSQIFSQGFMYAFLEPQSLVCSKDRRSECEQYLERWLKESDREVYIGPYFHHVMTKLKKTLSPETKAVAPKWIEVKSHVQTGCYECGYYIMHWIWNIITSDIKSDWSMWFANDTPLDIDIITTIRKKWATFFLKTAISQNG
ncbi:hypothetical protein GmHk_15G043983 [Glycine max]|nr:hypothetical protein GmHk_15G043983 [Glycine max]